MHDAIRLGCELLQKWFPHADGTGGDNGERRPRNALVGGPGHGDAKDTLRADTVGRVRPSWLFGDRVDYDLTDGDVSRLREGMKRLAELHFAAGAEQVFPGVAGLPEVLTSSDQLRLFDDAPVDPRAYSLVATHLFGGCVAGRDAATSVVDPQLRVHGTDGLYVMDASVFPSNTGVNPQHSIMAIARVAAARLVG